MVSSSQLLLRGISGNSSRTRLSNNRSVMPLDVLGRTRATLKGSTSFPPPRGAGNPFKAFLDRDWGLQLFPMNEEFPVSASHQLALTTSLPFVHTARRYYRLNDLVRPSDWRSWIVGPVAREGFLGSSPRADGKMSKLDHLEEVKVVTRFP